MTTSALHDLVLDCENQLGWSGEDGVPIWQARVREVGKLRRVLLVRTDVSIADLRIALAYCRRRRETINSPLELFAKVALAKELAVTPDRVSDLTIDHRSALVWEQMNPDQQSDHWISRLVRCAPVVRAEVLAEWRAAGRGC